MAYATAHYCRLNYIGDVISYYMMPEDCPVDKIIEKANTYADRLAKLTNE